MKNFLAGIILVFSTSLFAQVSLNYSDLTSSFDLNFNNGSVCRVDPSFGLPVLGYGDNDRKATANAISNCIAAGNSSMFCDNDIVCEDIVLGEGGASVSIIARGDNIGINFSSGVKATCYAEAAFGKGVFFADAPTVTEAEVYAQTLCIEQTGLNKMHCDIEHCERTGNFIDSNGSISINDSITDLFGSGRTVEQRIEALEAEIEDLNIELKNETSSRKRKKIRKKIQRKENKLAELKG